jgi:hypothetical protein
MKDRFISLLRQPSAAGFTLSDVVVISGVCALVVAILYPVFTHA